jgi:autotransporter-associated beta strand protein
VLPSSVLDHQSLPPRRVIAAIGLVLALATTTFGQTWSGAGSDNQWTTADNWVGGEAPGPNADVVFDGSTSQLSNTLGATFTMKSLTFTTNQTTPVTISSVVAQPLSFAPGQILDVRAGSHSYVATNSGGSGTPYGWVFGTAGATAAYSLNVDSGASFTISSRMGLGGSGTAFEKTGGGTLVLNADNGGSGGWNFNDKLTDGFAIQAGVVRWTNSAARGLTSNVWTVKAGAALEVGVTGNINLGTGQVNLAGDGIGGTGALRALSGTGALSSYSTAVVNLTANASIGVDTPTGLFSIPYPLTGTGQLTKVGAGTLRLNPGSSTTNTFSGGTRIVAGTLQTAQAAPASQVVGTGSLEIAGGTLDIGSTATTASTLPLFAGANFGMSAGSLNVLLDTALDKITASGSSTFSITGGTLALTLGAGFNYSSSYQILEGFSSGSVSGLTITGYDTTTYVASLSNSGVITFVPEPSTWAVAGSAAGLVSLAISRRRRGFTAQRRC